MEPTCTTLFYIWDAVKRSNTNDKMNTPNTVTYRLKKRMLLQQRCLLYNWSGFKLSSKQIDRDVAKLLSHTNVLDDAKPFRQPSDQAHCSQAGRGEGTSAPWTRFVGDLTFLRHSLSVGNHSGSWQLMLMLACALVISQDCRNVQDHQYPWQ